MKLVVFSHKPCWPCADSPSGYATDGGFPFQMRALSELFDATTLVVPSSEPVTRAGEIPLEGHRLSIAALSMPAGQDLVRKLRLGFWLVRNFPVMLRELIKADAVHAPIPGDIGTIGMLLAFVLRKPLFIRYCGNWFVQRTIAERFWKWSIERFAGGRNVALATGGALDPPSQANGSIGWVFSTSLTEAELRQYSAKRDPGFPEGIRLITVCRQEKGKGTEAVIQSLPLVLKQFPNSRLNVVGDGSALDSFKRLAVSLGLEERVCFHGKVNHQKVMELLQTSDIFCYPTASEGFPKAVLEALACGLPVVTTRVSVLPQLIGNGCGVLIDEVTPTAIAQAVESCMSDTDIYRTMSVCAKETAWQYSLERWRDTIGDTLQLAWGPSRSNA